MLSTAPSAEVAETVGVLSDFMRFMVTLPHTEGLTLSELGVLNGVIGEHAMRISELADMQGMTQPGMTQLITRMERDGLVAREPDPADRRAVRVVARPRGRKLFNQRDASRLALFGRLYEHLDETDKRRLHDALPVLSRLVEINDALGS
ncbi:MAG: MarR family transcriptional regulator [Solirubrobacterales bacterium]|nr:MarR family transcriptional regulator [Solirubrobacterales bacterium]